METKSRYTLVAVGGTFDIFHLGHETLLKKAFEIGEFVIIGFTSNEMVVKEVKPYTDRKKALQNFLKENRFIYNYKIIKLNDPYGPATDDEKIEAIVVSKETKKGADKINNIREKKGLTTLSIVTVSMVLAEDNKRISSTRIRNGEINREGKLEKKWNE